jgi:hypothetical protein
MHGPATASRYAKSALVVATPGATTHRHALHVLCGEFSPFPCSPLPTAAYYSGRFVCPWLCSIFDHCMTPRAPCLVPGGLVRSACMHDLCLTPPTHLDTANIGSSASTALR